MTDRGQLVLDAARSLIGTRFRLHGRHPELGLDCLGVVGWSVAQVTGWVRLPLDYGFRQRDLLRLLPLAAELGLRETKACGDPLSGDVLLFEVGPWQNHLGISDGKTGLIHAHAGLSRVVHGRPDPAWTLLRRWRLDSE